MITEKVILLVEDNPNDEELMLAALEKSRIGNEVVSVHDGVEALDYLFGHEGRGVPPGVLPAVVLLDLKLPKVDGIEVLKRIRADSRTRLLPVVILTSSKEERDLLAAYSSGCNSYVCKPIDFDQFVQAVQHLGLYWLILSERPLQPA